MQWLSNPLPLLLLPDECFFHPASPMGHDITPPIVEGLSVSFRANGGTEQMDPQRSREMNALGASAFASNPSSLFCGLSVSTADSPAADPIFHHPTVDRCRLPLGRSPPGMQPIQLESVRPEQPLQYISSTADDCELSWSLEVLDGAAAIASFEDDGDGSDGDESPAVRGALLTPRPEPEVLDTGKRHRASKRGSTAESILPRRLRGRRSRATDTPCGGGGGEGILK